MAEAMVRCCLIVPTEIVADGPRLCELLTEALGRVAAETQPVGWRLQGEPAAFILQPEHAVALAWTSPCPRTPATTWWWCSAWPLPTSWTRCWPAED
jgi:hypothetical protein